LLEWVSNTNALKSILEKGYGRHGKKLYVSKASSFARANVRTTNYIRFTSKPASKAQPP